MEEIEKLSNEKSCEALKIGIRKLADELQLNISETEEDIIKNDNSRDKLFSYWIFLCEMRIIRERTRITDDLIKICKEV